LTKLQGVCSNCHPQLDWRCSDTTCINNTQVCDGREDCSDGGHEQFCNFICYDMQTIDMEKVCDQVPDCPEGEDEDNCQVKAEEMIVNYDGQESGDYEEEDNGGTFGSWDLW